MELGLKVREGGMEVVAFEVTLENGQTVSVLPYARVEWKGARYVLARVLSSPDEAIILVEAGDQLVQVAGKTAEQVLELAHQQR